ncbi:PREDICTED: NACHT, LRR and PYD domains-containing protein 11 [Elephantulus edwardii]|uniref:NACHT, LRR and PYD domains-containing protein 11 n=1 Tax=Elephantulus edwardii TaxID=28737 RepID=UPI0003F0609C|nr:PREDICTED: NACHT, LRR and PYD domains-containing protein 11 [Elephantulus edwardii]
MAEASLDFSLLWYLEKLNNEDFERFKRHLPEALVEFGLPPLTGLQLTATEREDVEKMLTTSYAPQAIWNIAFGIFEKMGCCELCDRISARRDRNEEAYKEIIRRNITLSFREDLYPLIHNDFYNEISSKCLQNFEAIFSPGVGMEERSIVLMVGDEGVGKTMVIKMMLARWLSGEMWKGTFKYIIPISSCEINHMDPGTFAQLLSKDWPGSQAPIADILADPQKLLFIIEDFDSIEFKLDTDQGHLCTDSKELVSGPVLLASLMEGKMAPGCSLLISTRPRNWAFMYKFTNARSHISSLSFCSKAREKYFQLYFPNVVDYETYVGYIECDETLKEVCSTPILCWVVGETIRECADFTSTGIFVTFICKMFQSLGPISPWQKMSTLKRLCSLALQGLLQNVFHFSDQDLESVGFVDGDIFDLQAARLLVPSSRHRGRYMFLHRRLQEFCAAVALMTVSIEVTLPSACGVEKRSRERVLSPVMVYVFGLLNRDVCSYFNARFSCQLLRDLYLEYFIKETEILGRDSRAMEQHVPLFCCLYECKEEDFIQQIVKPFVKATVLIQTNKDLVVSTYSLYHCKSLKKLRLCVPIFLNKSHSVEPTNRMSYLKFNLAFVNLFKTIIQKRHLTHLNLKCTSVTQDMFAVLQEVLTQPECSIEQLSLVRCDLKAGVCENLAVLIRSRKLKRLNLSENPLGDKGIKHLCNVLMDADCVLQSLNPFIGKVLMLNRTLTHLDLSMNHLENTGGKDLMLALTGPNCQLQELDLSASSVTTYICSEVARVLISNRNLKSLELGDNQIGDAGMEPLCKALRDPNCILVNLGLEGCMLTSACCENLASVFIRNRTLKTLNLLGNGLGEEGVMKLLVGLGHPDCVLEQIG